MNLENYAQAKELKQLLKNKNIFDIILFGSLIKGKINPEDIDVAVICRENMPLKLNEKFHVSIIQIEDFFVKPISLVTTLFREGYSLRHNKPFSEVFHFENKVLFVYELKGLSNSKKVQIVNILRGNTKIKGLVERNKGEWISRQAFFAPVVNENIFTDFFNFNNLKYKKSYVLIH